MAEKTIIQLGKVVKNFILPDQSGQNFTLSTMRGRLVLLSFHPLAWTPVCTMQMQSLEKNKKIFDKLNTIAVGLSVDSVPCKAAWAKAIKIKNTKLLADFWPHGNVAKGIGLFREQNGFSKAKISFNFCIHSIFFGVGSLSGISIQLSPTMPGPMP